jgi:hypothetical protein
MNTARTARTKQTPHTKQRDAGEQRHTKGTPKEHLHQGTLPRAAHTHVGDQHKVATSLTQKPRWPRPRWLVQRWLLQGYYKDGSYKDGYELDTKTKKPQRQRALTTFLRSSSLAILAPTCFSLSMASFRRFAAS